MEDRTGYFVRNGWKTPAGKRTRQKVIAYIKSSTSPDPVLEDYVDESLFTKLLNGESLDFSTFCVSDTADFRGIEFKGEDFSGSEILANMDLSYCVFKKCTMLNSSFEFANLTETEFNICKMKGSSFANSSGQDTVFYGCELQETCWVYSFFQGIDFSSSYLQNAIFYKASLTEIKVDVKTIIDRKISARYGAHSVSSYTKAKLYHELRMAYQIIHHQSQRDGYFRLENRWRNKNDIENSKCTKYSCWHDRKRFLNWYDNGKKYCEIFLGLFTGYGTRSWIIACLAVGTIVGFSWVYHASECLMEGSDARAVMYIDSLYFSIETFTTLGSGSVFVDPANKLMRIASAFESLFGLFLSAVYIAILINIYYEKILSRCNTIVKDTMERE